MNLNFIAGFVKQAEANGMTKADALTVIKEAGPMDWLGNKWTNLKDSINTNVNLSNNPVSHFISAATTSGPEGYFDGFSKRYNQSMDIDNAQNMDAYNLAAKHRSAQGDFDGMKANLDGAQQYGSYLQDERAMNKGLSNMTWVQNDWNSRQAKIQADQQAAETKRAPMYNAMVKPLELAEPGKALTPATSPSPSLSPSSTPLLGGSSGIDQLRTSFNDNQNLRKPMGGY